MAATWVERRLAAILVADVVGYSHLVEQDEARTLAALKTLRHGVIDPLLAEYHGRIVKMTGDGTIAEFGSVVDAVACAVAVQKRVAEQQEEVPPEWRIVFRIGINLGDVVIEGEDLLGDGVNVAARLERMCEPGSVLISGTAYDQLQGKLDLRIEPAREQRLKNITRPIRTYRVQPAERQASRPPRLWGRRGLVPAAMAVVLVLALSAGAWLWLNLEGRTLAEQPSIEVLPFNLNVAMKVGHSPIIHGVKNRNCGDPAPSWAEAAAALPVSSLGTFLDGGVASRISRLCGGIVPARAIRFQAVKTGSEVVNIEGDAISITVQ